MKTTFLEYTKIIIKKVSFDSRLVFKEYCKACKRLNDREKDALDRWIIAQKKQDQQFPLSPIDTNKYRIA